MHFHTPITPFMYPSAPHALGALCVPAPPCTKCPFIHQSPNEPVILCASCPFTSQSLVPACTKCPLPAPVNRHGHISCRQIVRTWYSSLRVLPEISTLIFMVLVHKHLCPLYLNTLHHQVHHRIQVRSKWDFVTITHKHIWIREYYIYYIYIYIYILYTHIYIIYIHIYIYICCSSIHRG